jgi:hypothetical protein
MTLSLLLLILGFVLLIAHAAGARVPLWTAVLCLFIFHLLAVIRL